MRFLGVYWDWPASVIVLVNLYYFRKKGIIVLNKTTKSLRDKGLLMMAGAPLNGKGDSTHSRENQQYVSLIEQLDLMIRARYPLLYVISVEEEPVEEVLLQVASRSAPQRQVLFWDIVRVGVTMVQIKVL